MEKKTTREKLHEPTFAEKVRPILSELEDAFVDFRTDYPGELAGFNKDDLRAVLLMFYDVALEQIWDYHERLHLSLEEREVAVVRFANEIHTTIFNHCDIDTKKLFKK